MLLQQVRWNIVYRKILTAVDGSHASDLALREAIKVARAFGASARIIHVIDEFIPVSVDTAAVAIDIIGMTREAAEALLDSALQEAEAQGVRADAQIVEAFGKAASDAILKHAAEYGADLISMGTHGRRGLRRLVLGSDAENVVRRATLPVLLTRAVSEKEEHSP